jgi:hypothetical protein
LIKGNSAPPDSVQDTHVQGDQLPMIVQLAAEFTIAAGTAHRVMVSSKLTVSRDASIEP